MNTTPPPGSDPKFNRGSENIADQPPLEPSTQEAPPSDADQGAAERSGNVNSGSEVLGGPSQDPTLRDPEEWVTGDDPATEAQKSYLDRLAREAGEQIPADGLTKAKASEHIDRLQDETGMGPRQS